MAGGQLERIYVPLRVLEGPGPLMPSPSNMSLVVLLASISLQGVSAPVASGKIR